MRLKDKWDQVYSNGVEPPRLVEVKHVNLLRNGKIVGKVAGEKVVLRSKNHMVWVPLL